ncbi:MAG: hypothetical protein GWN88_11320, partial [Nitrospinaceae bacterium]|nr:hypothetical protein [Nitrospinaceae bacterium]NIU44704.1 hypothetical protein [Nitrospinaceae bacterium]NIU96871.1 hypothetical protein [Nitrospinaceae bacterium]NIW59456.1 hypothetical protein [Nitrospinaceae bacterium]
MLKDRARWMEVLSVLLVWGGLASCASPKPVLDAETSPPRLENLVEVQPAELPGKGEAEKPTEMTLVQPSLELRTSSVDQPRYSLSGRDVDLKTLLLALSQEIDRNIVVDPSIAETVTVDLKQVTLEEALDGLLHPLNLQYGVKEDV